jgi:hypothetical protein
MQQPDWTQRHTADVDPVQQIADIDQDNVAQTVGMQVFGPISF